MSQPPPLVERAEPGDRQAVVELFSEDLRDLNLPVDPAALCGVFDELVADPRSVVLVVRIAADRPACGVMVASRVPSVKFSGWSLWIEELYVGKAARQRGLGRLLIEHLLGIARRENLRGIDLEAYHGNAPAALLYRSLGFRRLGRERFHYRMDWEREDET